MRVVDVRSLILKVGTDAGVAMLLSIPGEDAADILGDCPEREGAELLASIASAQPSAASDIMTMLPTARAARLLEQLRSRAAADILAAMPTTGAVRILDRASTQAAARGVKDVPVRHAVPLLRGMNTYHVGRPCSAVSTPSPPRPYFARTGDWRLPCCPCLRTPSAGTSPGIGKRA